MGGKTVRCVGAARASRTKGQIKHLEHHIRERAIQSIPRGARTFDPMFESFNNYAGGPTDHIERIRFVHVWLEIGTNSTKDKSPR